MTKDIELSERDIQMRQQQSDELELKLAKLNLNKYQLEKTIADELPMKEARLVLRQIQSEIETAEQNIKTLAKQIREKKMVINE